jgi:hypothetical protein
MSRWERQLERLFSREIGLNQRNKVPLIQGKIMGDTHQDRVSNHSTSVVEPRGIRQTGRDLRARKRPPSLRSYGRAGHECRAPNRINSAKQLDVGCSMFDVGCCASLFSSGGAVGHRCPTSPAFIRGYPFLAVASAIGLVWSSPGPNLNLSLEGDSTSAIEPRGIRQTGRDLRARKRPPSLRSYGRAGHEYRAPNRIN